MGECLLNSDLIFYIANETYANEKYLKNSLFCTNIKINNIFFSVNPKGLLSILSKTIKFNKLIFIVGGFSPFNKTSIESLISKSLASYSNSNNYNIIKCGDSNIGKLSANRGCCIIENSIQSIVILPDDPKQLLNAMKNFVLDYIDIKYNLKK